MIPLASDVPTSRQRPALPVSRLIVLLVAALTVATILAAGTRASETPKCVHVIVALCDNQNQGIVPVPAALGNGQDPANNLYWGAMYGLRTFFTKSPDWTRMDLAAPARPGNHSVLERALFHQADTNTYLLAEAYDGRRMKEALEAFLYPNASELLLTPSRRLPLGPGADLRVFVGHNGLMDMTIPPRRSKHENASTPAIILCCRSRSYFDPLLPSAGMWGLLRTQGLMAPEAYTLEAAVSAWARGQDPADVHAAAARAYAKYQRIDLNSALRLFARADNPPPPSSRRAVSTIPCPPAFRRVSLQEDSFAAHVRSIPLKPPGTPVRSWDDRILRSEPKVLAVVDWPLPSRVQQCADVAIRLHAEYLRDHNRFDQISYRSLSNDPIDYGKWLRGAYRVNAAGTRIIYSPSPQVRSDSDAAFEAYLRFVMAYANSASLARDLDRVDDDALLPGDLYIQPDATGRGGVGHVSVLMDLCAASQGSRLFLFGYGFIPAQDFHLPSASRDPSRNGWFTLSAFKEHVVPFGAGAFHRFPPSPR